MQAFKRAGRSQMTDPTKPPIDLSGLRTLPLDSPAAPAEQKPLQPGQVFAGRYKIEAAIGEGGAGAIYRAIDETSEEAVALKVLRAGLAPTPEARKRLVRETILARNIRHANVVAVHDVGSAGEQVYMVMEFLEGQPLRRWLRSQNSRGVDCPVPAASAIIMAILDGLDAAHAQGVVHRDLKPENIFLLSEPGEGAMRLKILDFGLARADGPQASEASMMGTPFYMAPEQLTTPDTARASADLYSLSVMFYELLVGVVPQRHWQPPSRSRADVPQAIDMLIERGLSDHARSRPQSVGEYRAALLTALTTPKPAPPAPAKTATEAAPPVPAPVTSAPPAPPPAPALNVADMLKRAQELADKASDMAHARKAGWNIPWDNAHDLYKQAARTGDTDAKVAYGHFLRKGLGGYWPAEPATARLWYKSAAADGSGEAMCSLGQMDRFGHGGPKDPVASISWYIKAGEAGYAQGDYMAGFAYNAKLGDWGGKTDYPRARYHYERAAKKGETSAMIHLGEMLAEGIGGPKDRAAAREWFEKAEKAGHDTATEKLKDYKLR